MPNFGFILPITKIRAGVGGKSRFTVVRMEKDTQIMIITIDLLTQKNATVQIYARPCTV